MRSTIQIYIFRLRFGLVNAINISLGFKRRIVCGVYQMFIIVSFISYVIICNAQKTGIFHVISYNIKFR